MIPSAVEAGASVSSNLRQMIAVLKEERQALASLDLDGLTASTNGKEALCDALRSVGPDELDEQTRSLAQTAQHLNEVNRRVRNLLAANVAARLEALGGAQHSYVAKGLIRA